MTDCSKLWDWVEHHGQDVVTFAQALIRTPSMPGAEADVAARMRAKMERLGYDETWIDEAGNAVGLIRGGDGPSLMFNGHMDHVAAGEQSLWAHPPFGGEIHDGELWGRGAADMKGALAAMIYAGGLIKDLGLRPRGDLYVSGVVQEEVGGLGARYLARTLPVARAVIGEASANHLRRGHRGRVELGVHFEGRSVHASMPHLGVNPHYSLARFVAGLREIEMVAQPAYGTSTVAPTLMDGEPASANVTPWRLSLILDWRNVPQEEPSEVVAKVEALLARSLEAGCKGLVEITTKDLVSHTGLPLSYPDIFPSFSTPANHPWLAEARVVLAEALDREPEVGAWPFATDGGHFAAAGATVLGFGPGDAKLVHTVEERLRVDQLIESVVGFAALGLT